jgi:CheY-like chemotaxis protein
MRPRGAPSVVSEVLETPGYTIQEAEDGPSDLSILDSNTRIDLLISDVGLPGGLNGCQVADAARARQPSLKGPYSTDLPQATPACLMLSVEAAAHGGECG